MTKAEKTAVRQLLRACRWDNNGCSCCATQDTYQRPEFKLVAELSDYEEEAE